MVCVGVIIEGLANSIDKQYDYELPPELEKTVKVGCRVVVPFGNSNRKMQALVVNINNQESDFKLKQVISQIDKNPIVSDELLKTVFFIKERTFCNFFDAFSTVVPAGVRLKLKNIYKISQNLDLNILTGLQTKIYSLIKKKPSCDLNYLNKATDTDCKDDVDFLLKHNYITCSTDTFRHVNDLLIKSARLNVSKEEADNYCNSIKNNEKHKRIIDILISCESAPVAELSYLAGVSSSVLKTLEKRGIIELFDLEIFRNPFINTALQDNSEIKLSTKQNKIFDRLKDKFTSERPSISLLYGVTGSGKTLVYLKLIDSALKLNKETIVLVPEISLTPQLTGKMFERYGNKIAVMHSGLSLGERFDEYKRIKNGDAKIAIGTRSCIFAPFENLGLIIIDEEQEHTYKSENSPRYHAKDVAKFRAAYNNALLLLCSATPSIESFSLAKSGKYDLLKLDERYGEAELPEVIVCDLKEEMLEINKFALSEKLIQEIEINLKNKEQTVLFLNRRGYTSILSCRSCGFVFDCDNCSIAMTYHIKNDSLMCHYCGKYSDKPNKCPSCGSVHIKHFGIGTQRIEEQLKEKFEYAKIERMDMDTTQSKNSHDRIINRLINGEIDILIGTQMVTKGLDIPNVTLVGILLADGLLYADDFRANERAFALLTQVEGRAGRSHKKGRAIIQTYTPNNRVIEFAQNQDYEGFYKEEIAYRKSVILPPYCDMLFINFADENLEICKQSAESCFEYIMSNAKGIKNFIIYPPLPSPLGRMNKKYRYRIMIKCNNDKNIRTLIENMLQEFYSQKKYKSTSLYCDFNSYSAI